MEMASNLFRKCCMLGYMIHDVALYFNLIWSYLSRSSDLHIEYMMIYIWIIGDEFY